MNRIAIKERAKAQLGRNIFSTAWLVALAVCFVSGAINAAVNTIIPGIAALILTGPFAYGLNYIFLKQTRDGSPMNFTDMFKGFTDDIGQNILIGLLSTLFTVLWGLLFVIPGIVKAYAYSFAYYVKADHPDYDWKRCIDESIALTNGHKWELFILDLSFIGWLIVGALCFGVGTLWVTPYMAASKSQFYNELVSAPQI